MILIMTVINGVGDDGDNSDNDNDGDSDYEGDDDDVVRIMITRGRYNSLHSGL